MKRKTALLFLLLSIMLIFSTTGLAQPDPSSSIQNNPDSSSQLPYQKISENQFDEKLVEEAMQNVQFTKSEVMDYRTEYSQMFQNENGTLTEEIHSRPIFFKQNNGKFIKINNRVVKQNDGSYLNAANKWKVRFSNSQKNSNMVSLTYKNYAFNMSLISPKSTNAKKYESQNKNAKLPFGLIDGSTVIYENVFDNVDLSYTVLSGGIKENIIVKSYTGQSEFQFRAEIKNVEPKVNEYGDTIFCDKNGEEIFFIGGLFAIDANQNTTQNVKCSVEKSAGDFYIIRTVIDKDFLEKAAYPVIIDPTVTVSGGATKDAFIGSKEPDRNFNSGTNMPYLRTGNDTAYFIRRSYVSFNNPSLPSGSTISSAVIKLFRHSSAGAINLRAYRVIAPWASDTITWNNKPSYTTTDAGTGSSVGNDWYAMMVTNWVKGFVSGAYTNYGFCIMDTTETDTNVWATWRSSDYAGDTYDPILRVNYTNPNTINRSVKMLCEDIFRRDHSDYATTAISYVNAATTAFTNTYTVKLNPGTVYDASYFPGSYCPRLKTQLCDSSNCGSVCLDNTSSPNHHKNAYRVYGTGVSMGTSGHNLSVTFADHYFCSSNGSQVFGLGGGSAVRYALLDICHGYYDNIRLFQHEVSHCFGCPDGGDPITCTPGQPCIMSGGFNGQNSVATGTIWCDRCISTFDPSRIY